MGNVCSVWDTSQSTSAAAAAATAAAAAAAAATTAPRNVMIINTKMKLIV